jgi:hypothetical protein
MTTTSYNIYQQITSVRVATTANLSSNYFNGALNNGVGATLTALSVGALTIDGILLEVGNRVLVKNQTSANQNGLYVVQTPGGFAGLWMLERAPDFQSVEQLKVGQYFTVGAGSTLAGSMFVLVEPLPSVIGMGTFNFVDVADVDTPSGPFLLKADNLSDLSNRRTAFQNLGFGNASLLVLTDADFAGAGGTYVLSNPPPNIVSMTTTSPGRVLQLPPSNDPNSLQVSEQIELLTGTPSNQININNGAGTLIFNVQADSSWRAVSNDTTTVAGSWEFIGEVQTINGSVTGNISLTSADSSINIVTDPTTETVDFSVTGRGGIVPSQMIFVDAINGNDSNTGAISDPLQSYEAARLLAVSRNPQYGSGQTIVVMTSLSITGNMTISPFVSVVGFGKYCTIIGGFTDIVLDASFGTTAFPAANISNIALIGNSINFVYSAFQSYSTIRFENCSIQLLNAGPTATFTGSDGSGTSDCETVILLNCTLDLAIGAPDPIYISNNVNLFLLNTGASNAIVSSVTSATVQATLLVQDAISNVGNITLTTTSTGTLSTQIAGCNTESSALTINGTSNTVTIDADSYKFNGFIFSGGASYSNINGGIPLIIYIDQLNGNDNSSGTVNYPMQNYEQARLAAIARLGSALQTQGCLIVVVGTHNITGDMTLTPGISIDSQSSPYKSGFIVTGNVVLDPTWGTTFSLVQVRNIYIFLTGGIYSFVFPAMDATGNSFLKFANCEFNTLTTMIITGAGSSNGIEEVTFENCTNDLQNYSPGFTAENVNLYLINNDLSASDISMTVSTALGFNYVLAINNARFYTGNISVITNNTSTLTTYITACNTSGKTLTIDGANNTVIIDATSYNFSNFIFSGGASYSNINGSIPFLIYIDQLNGNDSYSGTVNYPMKTYEAARLQAIARGASSNQPWTIVIVGAQNITGNMTLSANVCIEGQNPYSCVVSVSGDIIIDSNWGATDFAYTQVRNMSMYVGGNYTFTFTHPQVFSFLKFVNIAMNDGGFINITGNGTASGIETVTFENCTNEIPGYADGFIAENVNLFLINTDISNGTVTVTASSADPVNYQFVLNDARFYTNNISVVTNNTSTLTTYINACNTQGKTLTIDGSNNTVNVDSSSYMFTLALAGGATLSNLNLPTKTDGMVNSSYNALNYSATGGTLFASNTLTGNLKGIDNALPQSTINGMTYFSSLGTSAVSVVRSHEIKLGNMVAGSIVFTFTATSSPVSIKFTKSYGSSFSTNINQAIGSGICAKDPTTAIGDASVQNINADFPNPYVRVVMDVNGNTDYQAEVSFTYEVT